MWFATALGSPAAEDIPEVHIAQIGNPVSLACPDRSSTDEGDVLQHFAERPFQFDRQNVLQPRLVERFEMIDVTEWILHLRRGVRFHDPTYGDMHADDFIASLDFCFKAGSRNLGRIPAALVNRQVEIIDDYTIRMKLSPPGLASLPNHLGNWVFVSAKEYLETMGEKFSHKPMGTGPYRFVEWVPNVRIVGERFEDYWGEKPAVKRVVWRIIPDAFTRKSEFVTGGIDLLAFLVPEVVPEVEANPETRVESVMSSRYIFIMLPVSQPPYHDKRVRQALNYAVNKQEIVDELFRGIGAQALTGVVHPMLPEADPQRVGYPYDPEKAQALLSAARADGVAIGKIRLYAPNDRYTLDREIGEAVAGYWQAIGLDVAYYPESRTTLFPRLMGLESKDPVLIGNGNGLLRPEHPFELWLQARQNPTSRGATYASPHPAAWDDDISRLGLMTSGRPEALALARAMDHTWSDFAPWVFLINYQDLYGVRNAIEWKPYSTEQRPVVDMKPRKP
jgi:peptide/nickel transport system substrate-binding protein